MNLTDKPKTRAFLMELKELLKRHGATIGGDYEGDSQGIDSEHFEVDINGEGYTTINEFGLSLDHSDIKFEPALEVVRTIDNGMVSGVILAVPKELWDDELLNLKEEERDKKAREYLKQKNIEPLDEVYFSREGWIPWTKDKAAYVPCSSVFWTNLVIHNFKKKVRK
jgi:hypothetical protein